MVVLACGQGRPDPDRTTKIVDSLKGNMDSYHTKAMQSAFVNRYGILSGTSPTILTDMYRELTGDYSALPCAATATVHDRLKLALDAHDQLALDAQDPELVFDLQEMNSGRPETYQTFWDAVKAFLEAHAMQAVDSRRHGTVTHLAAAISTSDFVKQCSSLNMVKLLSSAISESLLYCTGNVQHSCQWMTNIWSRLESLAYQSLLWTVADQL